MPTKLWLMRVRPRRAQLASSPTLRANDVVVPMEWR
jgi:hypothetical protein